MSSGAWRRHDHARGSVWGQGLGQRGVHRLPRGQSRNRDHVVDDVGGRVEDADLRAASQALLGVLGEVQDRPAADDLGRAQVDCSTGPGPLAQPVRTVASTAAARTARGRSRGLSAVGVRAQPQARRRRFRRGAHAADRFLGDLPPTRPSSSPVKRAIMAVSMVAVSEASTSSARVTSQHISEGSIEQPRHLPDPAVVRRDRGPE